VVVEGQDIATLRTQTNGNGQVQATITATCAGVLTRNATQGQNLNAANTTTTIATIATPVTFTERPVIVYLAAESDGTEVVKYAYTDSVLPAAGDWTVDYVKQQDNTKITNAGRYISMKIDNNRGAASSNDMHIAFMNSDSGDLIYVHGTRNATDGSYAFDKPVTVDSVGNVGKWTDITLDEAGRPYISYLDQGGIDSRTGLKIAFYDPSNTAFAVTDPDSSFFASSGWEYVTLPGRYVVNDVRTQIECDTEATQYWNAALAYVSGNDYRISYYVK
jgi:hypothetical protein